VKAAALLAVLVLVVAGCAGGDEESTAKLPLGSRISTTAELTPGVHLFAEPAVARLDVVVDRDHLDPDRLTLQTKFLPYDVEESAEVREERGRFTVLRYAWVLRCVRIGCIPEIVESVAGEDETGRGERRSLRLPPAEILYDDPEGERRVVSRARWPEVVSASRIRHSDVPRFGFAFKISPVPLPDPDYRVRPAYLAAGLLAGALLLLALPVALVAGWARARRPQPVVVEERELTPLERALRLVEWARERQDGTERREALEALAFELDVLARPEIARSARTLAWSPPSPTPEAADELVERVRVGDAEE
jgi:hypothetical protein